MSDIDLKRLAEDREYWDKESAPGAERVFFCDGCPVYLRRVLVPGGRAVQFFSVPYWAWVPFDTVAEGVSAWSMSVRKPAKRPQEVEWVDGLPPVGCECEVHMHGSQWAKARVVGHDEEAGIRAAVCRVGDSYYAFSSKCIRHAPTKEQRLRDDLASICRSMIGETDMRKVADAIIAAGYRKPEAD